MKKGLTEIVFILDRSGSMSGLEKDTIGGFNGMLAKQKKEPGEVIFSTILFDDAIEVLHDRVDIKNVKPMTSKQYYVRGGTALLDAVGGAIKHIKKVRKEMPKEERPEKTIFIITTDGMENCSCKYSYHKVKELIEKRQKKNWEFIFLGANIDAAAEANKLGIRAGRAVNYHCDPIGTAVNYQVLSKTLSTMRSSKDAQVMSACLDKGDWAEEITRDFEKRK